MSENENLENNDAPIIDTSKMSEGKRKAMDIAEDARQTSWKYPSFAKSMFMGHFEPDFLYPFPDIKDEELKPAKDLLEQVTPFLKEHLDPEEVDMNEKIPDNVVEYLKEVGVFAMKVPTEYKGLGFNQVNYNYFMRAIASYCSSTAILISAHQSIGVPQPLKLFGTDEQKNKFLPRFREGAISAFALTEPNAGSDPARMTTVAKKSDDGSHYIINGDKIWITNGLIADILVVMAKTDSIVIKGKEREQITAFIVEGNSPGISTPHKCRFMGIKGIENGLIRFENVKVPAENIILGEGKGLKLALTTLNTGRLTLPAASAGIAKQCLNMAIKFGQERKQWGLPVGEHEAGRTKLANIASAVFSLDAVTWLTSHWADKGDIDIRLEAAMAKLYSTEVTWTIADETLQLLGGRGYETAQSKKDRGEVPYPIERILRDCRINRIIEGTSEIMKLFLAREAMDYHLRLAADLIRKHTPFGKKIKAGAKLAQYYATWYPNQWVNDSLWSTYDELGELSDHFHYVDVTSHRLARTIFHYMGLYQDRLERQQNILFNLMDIGTELFVMSAVCSYAKSNMVNDTGKGNASSLAHYHCVNAKVRIEDYFRALKQTDGKSIRSLSTKALGDEYKWLEEGIIPLF
ncbi:MAG: acyl-CoA dehydrogenase family protein [Planctomycetes bacterium]|nr:acyl-CoA dehydrogenase family protein [Planctomycetota bacterium]